MRFFTSNTPAKRKRSALMALAVAIAASGAVATAGVAEPAYAKSKKKKKKDKKAAYSPEFIAAYKPLEDAIKKEGADLNAAKGLVPALMSTMVSPDEKYAGGNVVYNLGARSQDRALQLQGMKSLLESGKATPEQAPQFNFVAYQLETVAGNHGAARQYLQKAMDLNYSNANLGAADLQVAMAESFFSGDQYAQGLDYLTQAIRERRAAGLPIDQTWYQRGLSVAYKNEVKPHVYDIITMWVDDYPSSPNWRDAINMTRNLNTYQGPELLDLMRLSFELDTLQTKQEYIDYVESADARRLPKEVETVIAQGYSSGRIRQDDSYVAESLKIAKNRIVADRAELPSLEKDARAASAGLKTVVAAGNAFLSYGQYTKAEEFYQKALGMAGVDKSLVTTRLGISQVHLGKYTDAEMNFAKVTSENRMPIARLWAAYAAAKADDDTSMAAS